MKFTSHFLLIIGILLLSGKSFSQQWEAVNSQTNFILYGMHFPPGQNDVGYASGMQYTYDAPGVIVKTTDGGHTWNEIFPGVGEIDGLEAICFITPDKGFAAGWNNYFIKTTDGGTTWNPVTVGTDVWYYVDIEFWDENNGVAAAVMNAGGTRIYKTNNGGFSWTIGGTLPYTALDICYADQNTLYGVGTGNIISRSINGGQSWSNIYQSTGITMGVHFANTNFGVVGGEDGKILTTNDGGESWSSFSTGYHSFYAVHVFDKDSAYAGGTDADIYKTIDAGETWTLDHNGSGSSTMYNFSFTDNNTGFCSGSQGTMLRRNAPIATNFSADETEICNGSQIQFTDLSVEATNWEWYFEGGTPESSNDQNPVITYYYAGSYDVSLTASNSEQSQAIVQENYINVFEQPQPSITGSNAICIGETINYQTSGIDGNTYQWNVLGGEIVSGQNTSEISVLWTIADTGYVIVQETANNICVTSDSLMAYVSDCVGINESNHSVIKVYPNPTNDNLFVSLNCIESGLLTFSVYSPVGNKLYEQKYYSTKGQQEITLNLSELNQGIFILEIMQGKTTVRKMKFQKSAY